MGSMTDVVVIVGAMGSAALRTLGREDWRAPGIQRFLPGHDHGSSHGIVRALIRLG